MSKTMKFTREDARKRVLNCAKQYQQKLLNNISLPVELKRMINLNNYVYGGK